MPYLAAAFLILLLVLPVPPAGAQAPAEVVVSGMRNPYRWSFDRVTGDAYVGDVGGINEEVAYIPAASFRGANLGWNCFSGTAVQSACTPSGNYIEPSYEYPSGPDVVIGGYVVRDPELPSFAGQYLFGRFGSGSIMKLGPQAAQPVEDTGLDVPNVAGFGEDGVGHLYAASRAGTVYRLGESGGNLTKTPIPGSFDQPLSVSAAPGVTDELFIAEQAGNLIRWTPSGSSVFMDLTGVVRDTGTEEGFLSVAVSPDYATTHRIFGFYVDNGGDLQVDELRDGTRSPVLTIQHDQADNHNGGQLLFGPDGALYLSTGDGGTQGDPEGDAQNPNSRLGKILRIDVGGAAAPPARPERACGRRERPDRLGARGAASARRPAARGRRLRSLQRELLAERRRDAPHRAPEAPAPPQARRAQRRPPPAAAPEAPAAGAAAAPGQARERWPPAGEAAPSSYRRRRQPLSPGAARRPGETLGGVRESAVRRGWWPARERARRPPRPRARGRGA